MKLSRLSIVGVAFFLSTPLFAQQNTKEIIQSFLKQNSKTQTIPEFAVTNEDNSKSLKANVVKIQQTVGGVLVYNSVSTAVIRENKVHSYSDGFTKAKQEHSNVAKTGNGNFASIAADFGITAYKFVERFTLENHQANEVAVIHKKVYFEVDGILVLADEYQFEDHHSGNLWQVILRSSNGEILFKENQTLSCAFHNDAFGFSGKQIFPQPQMQYSNTSSLFVAPVDATYNVYPFPYENPNSGARQMVINPWIEEASPEGWHYVKTDAGEAHVTYTRSNNVYAIEDLDGNNLTIGAPTEGGGNRVFDFPIDFSQEPETYIDAAVTNLFYANNMIHDILYQFGFTETARNFQWYNFEKGGAEKDLVIAEAQDGSGRNNANFSSPADGSLARMQMFVWDPSVVYRLFYNAPAEAVEIKPETKNASFGPTLDATGITADVGIAQPIDGCGEFPELAFDGKIALIERGSCNFTVKVINAQKAGALGVIVYNQNEATAFGSMGGTPAETVNIPSILIKHNDGMYLRNLVENGTIANVTMKFDIEDNIPYDASLDNGIIIHEYAHGLSNRLTGTGSGCLSRTFSKEQMGEGWSDFAALMLTNRPGDNPNVARGIGTYVSGQDFNGLGIRPAKYSPDFSINDYTYGKTNGMEYLDGTTMIPHVHSIGFVWATILWDLHWKFVEKYGYSNNVLRDRNSGSSRVFQLVIDGMKLQTCNPTFIDGRDAILQADQIASNGENRCMIWETFAKRGVGVNANAGSKTNINDQVEDFSTPEDCNLSSMEIKKQELKIYPNPAQSYFKVDIPTDVRGKVNVTLLDVSGKVVLQKQVNAIENEVQISQLINGLYIVKIEGEGINFSSKLMIRK
ncbi:MAG: T9SS-dependent M36 family metallopeptidase [Cruoricaptor ignavus]|nr:T9SS-dependent M36 family metallopeptidase [Cruoricaptor ignavus]